MGGLLIILQLLFTVLLLGVSILAYTGYVPSGFEVYVPKVIISLCVLVAGTMIMRIFSNEDKPNF